MCKTAAARLRDNVLAFRPRPQPADKTGSCCEAGTYLVSPRRRRVRASPPGGESRGVLRAPQAAAAEPGHGGTAADSAPPLHPSLRGPVQHPPHASQFPSPLPSAPATSLPPLASAHPFPWSFSADPWRLPSQLNPRPLPAPRVVRCLALAVPSPGGGVGAGGKGTVGRQPSRSRLATAAASRGRLPPRKDPGPPPQGPRRARLL
ncbi:hypothetical protein P7K49_028192 [Saguinus oedipus]|uniref:Uncharacterized protein n=1 Tax=Saguinus oedipus TaxID=9490 RepID=A0ABQ9UBL5_SAGOE|nr:hypothetical protein P7K49_028192 [Saguinus oedipus]